MHQRTFIYLFILLGRSNHNQIPFDIKEKSESKNKKKYKRNFHIGKYKDENILSKARLE